jgi:hypothetical protein
MLFLQDHHSRFILLPAINTVQMSLRSVPAWPQFIQEEVPLYLFTLIRFIPTYYTGVITRSYHQGIRKKFIFKNV